MVRDLGLDWRMGAEWFETCLLDYDPCSNYGNWTYGAGEQLIHYHSYAFMRTQTMMLHESEIYDTFSALSKSAIQALCI